MSVSNPTPAAEAVSPAAPAISRNNLILIVLLLVQVAVVAYLFWPSSGATSSGEPILADVTAADVTSLTITDNNARSVSFAKEGDIWTLAGTDGYPARADKITETLDKLVAMTTERLVTQTAGSHDRLQVAEDNFQRKIEITTAGGTRTLYLGSSSGASATHVRAADNAATYLTSDVAAWELDTLPTTWIEVAYFKVPEEQISELTLTNANGSYTFVRNGEEWTLAGATADENVAPANIKTLIDRVTSLNLHTVLGKSDAPEYGLAAPLATLTVTTTTSTTDTASAALKSTVLTVGAKNAENNTYYFKSSDSEFYVLLAAFTGDEFVNKTRSDFMVQTAEANDGSASPAIDATTVPTDTGEVSGDTAITDTGTLTGTATVTATTDVTATDTITESTGAGAEATAEVDAGATVTTTGTAEVEVSETPTPRATPAN